MGGRLGMTDSRREPTFSPSRPVRVQAPKRRHSVAPIAVPLVALAIVAAGAFWWLRSGTPRALETPSTASTAGQTAAPPEPDSSSASVAPEPVLVPPPPGNL